MYRLKWLFQQTMMISFGIVVGLSIECICYRLVHDTVTLEWYHPISIVLAGFLCSLPSLVLDWAKDFTKAKYRLSIVLHFIFLFVIVMGMGYVFRWYTKIGGAIFVAVIFVGVYIFVWLASAWIGVMDQNKINDALDNIRDTE